MKRNQYARSKEDAILTREHRVHPHNPDILLPLRRSWRRLGDVSYRDPDCRCLVTICTLDKVPVFGDNARARLASDVLREQHERVRYDLFAYVVMPEHVHWVLAPGRSGLSIGEIVGRWKSFVLTRMMGKGRQRTIWQRDFDDRILRLDEREGSGLTRAIAYVMENPVRRNLARHWRDYPYGGCFVDIESG
jgi:putative transposase